MKTNFTVAQMLQSIRNLICVFLYVDYVIPKGCFVVPFLSAVHLNENIYDDPRSFNPWRWMDPENQVSHLTNS